MRPYLDFLAALAQHNHKEWMDANKSWYQSTRASLLEDAEVLLQEMVALEPSLAAFKAKNCLFRQNRDVRFSANKNPYKTNFGVYFSPTGKNSPGPGYYLQIQPGNSFLAGGIWMPEAEVLKKIRKEIDFSGAQLQHRTGAFIKFALDGFYAMKPFIDFLSQALEEVEDGADLL